MKWINNCGGEDRPSQLNINKTSFSPSSECLRKEKLGINSTPSDLIRKGELKKTPIVSGFKREVSYRCHTGYTIPLSGLCRHI